MATRAENYRARGEEMRILAEGMADPEAKAVMLSLADNWERMAKQAERVDRDPEKP